MNEEQTRAEPSAVGRRRLLAAAAWTVPAVALAAPAPAIAASQGGTIGPVYPTGTTQNVNFVAGSLPNLWGPGSATTVILKNGDTASVTATFPFNGLPAGAVVTAVTIEASFSSAQSGTNMTINAYGSGTVRGTITQTNMAANQVYALTSTQAPGTWTAAHFTSGQFWMTISTTSNTGNNVVSVDYVRVTVTYV